MYIIDKGDRLKLEDVEILISKEKITPTPKEEETIDVSEINKPRPTHDKTKTQTSLSLLKENKSKKGAGASQLKSLIGHTLEGPKPGIILRASCWIADLALSYALIYTIVPLLGIQNVWNEIIDILKMTIDPLLALIPPGQLTLLNMLPHSLYRFIVAWLLLELLGNLLFSVPFTYAFIGMKSTGSFLSKRLKALVRSPLVLLDLLIISNIQTLFKKKTLKEYITFSEIYIGSPALKNIGAFFLIPLIIIASLVSPLLTNQSALDGLQKEITLTSLTKLDPLKSDPNAINFSSRFFEIDAPKIVPTNIKIIPHLGKNQIWLIDPASKREVVFSKHKGKIPFNQIITQAKSSDPLFHFFYPALSATGKWDSNKQDQLNHFVQNILTLNLQTLPKYLSTHGPFIASHIVAKKQLLEALPDSISWDILPSKEIFQNIANKKGRKDQNFFVLSYPTGNYYRITGHPQAKKFTKYFTTLLFKKAQWKKPKPSDQFSGITFFELIDKLQKSSDKKYSKQVDLFYKQLTTDAKKSKNNAYQAVTLLSLQDTIKKLGGHNQKKPSTSLTTLLQKLQMLEIEYKDDIDLANIKDLIKRDLVK